MNDFHFLFNKTVSSQYFTKMVRSVDVLKQHLGVNHFWYYKITNSGNYTFLGTHLPWIEYCFGDPSLKHFTCLRHPENLKPGLQLMKCSDDENYQQILNTAWTKFNINLNINLIERVSDGVEAFGLGTFLNNSKIDEFLINELSLIRYFIKNFRQKNENIIQLANEYQVDLAKNFGYKFFERSPLMNFPSDRQQFLEDLGFGFIQDLSKRELELLRYLSSGFPSSYIAKELKISQRTVESYIENIKNKLNCNSKVELIILAKEVEKYAF